MRRIGAVAAAVAAAGFGLLSVHSLLEPGAEHWRDVVMVVPWGLMMVTLAGLHAVQRDAAGRGERWAFAAIESVMALNLGLLLAVVVGDRSLTGLAGPAGLLFVVAMAVFGGATVRAGVLPRRVGLALALAQPAVIVLGVALSPIAPLTDYGSYTGALGHAVVLALVARELHRDGGHRALAEPAVVPAVDSSAIASHRPTG